MSTLTNACPSPFDRQPLAQRRDELLSGTAPVALHDPPVPAKTAAVAAGLALPTFWRAVADGRLPAPVYPAPRAPRWYVSEIRTALAATRALPAEAKAGRRAAKLAAAG